MSYKVEAPRARWSNYWLLVKHETNSTDVLAVDLDSGGKALAVFSFVEEAGLFLYHELSGTGWQIRATTIGALIFILYGFCTDVEKVALDPLPRNAPCEEANDLVSLSRDDFTQALIARRRAPAATLS